MRAANSAPAPPVSGASCRITTRFVLATDSRIASSSNGRMERRSMISAETPSFARSPAASSATYTIAPHVRIVRSRPRRRTFAFPIGKANVRRRGRDLTILTWGAMVYVAEEAAGDLAKEGVSAEIIDLRSILPFDEEAILESVAKTNRVVILHEAPLTGGAGAEFAARIAEKAFDYLDAPIKRVAALDVPTPYSPPLEAFVLPDKARLLK